MIADVKNADRRADLYVVGVLLYELTTGQRMIEGDGMAYVNAVLAGPPPPPSGRTEREFPAAVEAVILRCLQRDPAKRFSDTRKLQLALENLAKTMDLRIGTDVIGNYASALQPESDEPISVKTVPPPFVVATEEVLEPEPIDHSVLSDEEHGALVADLDLFSIAPGPMEPVRDETFEGLESLEDDEPFEEPPQTQTRRRHPGIPDEGDFAVAFNDDE